MPNYQTHDKAAIVSVVPLTIAASVYLEPKYAVTFGVTFLISNYYLSPDLDTHSIMNRRWGIFFLFWKPYQTIIHHRSWLSHSGPLSALIKLLYIIIPLVLLLRLWYNTQEMVVWSQHNVSWLLALYLGVAASDTIHLLMDLYWKKTFGRVFSMFGHTYSRKRPKKRGYLRK